MIGTLLGNRYEILFQLGGGGMALIYKARDTLLNRPVTVKVLRPEYTDDEEFVARFRKEAQAVAKLSHPNIVSIYDVGQEGDTHYIVMEFVEGRNLKQVIKEMGRIPVKHAVDIARQICEGLQDAHEHGIVHRDIKPHNILVMDNGRIKVADFGIAQIMSSVTITNSATIVGSVHYFSPEQAKGGTTSIKSDIYSAGVVLYEMVTGRVPFEGETPIAVALKQIQEQPVPPSRINPQISPELERIILKAMDKEASLRYNSAGEMSRELGKISADPDGHYSENDEFATRVLQGPVVITKEKKLDEEEMNQRKRKRKVKPLAKIIIAAVIIGLLAGAVYGLNGYLNVSEVTVPNVENMPIEEAKVKLEKAKLTWDISMRYDPNVTNGNVITQDPPEGRQVKVNHKVMLTVSKGPEIGVVPDVIKKELDRAQVELDNAGFEHSTSEEFSEDVPIGAVVSQTPEGNTEAVKGTVVKLVISKGVEPKNVTVPDLTGLSLEEARTKLQAANLKLSSDITQEESTSYITGTVMRQEPVAGNQLNEGSEVKVVLSKGPGPIEKTAAVNVVIPNDGLAHKVKIVVSDEAGTRTAYESEHNPGEAFTRVVTYYNKGKIQVFIDDMQKPVEERLVE